MQGHSLSDQQDARMAAGGDHAKLKTIQKINAQGEGCRRAQFDVAPADAARPQRPKQPKAATQQDPA